MLLTVKLDPVGITRYVPKAQQVESVTVSPYSSYYSIHAQSITLTGEEDVAAVLKLHKDTIENPHRGGEDYLPVNLRYRLKDGRSVNRSYYVPEWAISRSWMGPTAARKA